MQDVIFWYHKCSLPHSITRFYFSNLSSPCWQDERAEWFTPSKKTTIGCMLQWVWESLWASTTCSISHILSHLRGHISSGLLSNYSTTHLTAIKRWTAGVQGSCKEPGCCHGHCHSADFQGWKEIWSALWLVVELFWPTERGSIQQSQALLLCNWTIRICTFVNTDQFDLLHWK